MKKIFTLFVAAMAMFSVANAQLAYNQAFTQADFNNAATVVAKNGDIAWANTNGIRLGASSTSIIGGPAWNWNEKYVIIALESGHCTALSFTTGVTSGGSTKGNGRFWYVATGATQDNLTTIWTEADKNNPGAVNLELNENVRFVKICFNGNFAGYVKNLTVSGVQIQATYASEEATVCPSELPYNFLGKDFTESGSVTLVGANELGGDSIVTLTLNVLPTYQIQDEAIQVYVGAEGTWHGRDLSTYAVGVYTLYDSLQTEAGCDSIYSVALTVEKRPTTYGEYSAAFCEGDSIEYNGVWYKEAFVLVDTLVAANYMGGDSIVTLTVTVNPTFFFDDELITIEEGTDSLWHEIPLSELEVGEHVLYDSLSVAETGCDSVWSVVVVVSQKYIVPTAIDETMVAPAVTKFFRNGCLYIRRGEALYDMSGRKVE